MKEIVNLKMNELVTDMFWYVKSNDKYTYEQIENQYDYYYKTYLFILSKYNTYKSAVTIPNSFLTNYLLFKSIDDKIIEYQNIVLAQADLDDYIENQNFYNQSFLNFRCQ